MGKNIILVIRRILIVLLILWMVGVFFLSNQKGNESSKLSQSVALFVSFGNEQSAENIEPTIRKVAHMTEYAIGAMLFYGILLTYQKFNAIPRVIMTIAFILAYSGIDELHQSFIDARSGSLIDVGIDAFGGLLGVGASYLLEGMIRIIDNKVQEETQMDKQ